MSTELFSDSHCHFGDEPLRSAAEEVYRRALEKGVRRFMIPEVHPSDERFIESFASSHEGVCRAFGIHPWAASEWDGKEFSPSSVSRSVRAIGECGLDRLHTSDFELETRLFEAHIALAERLRLPLLVHSLRANSEVLRVLKCHRARGVIHGFSGSFEEAMAFISLGFFLGAGGVITYARAQKTRKTFSRIPLRSILLETDSPAMPLSGFQGEANMPERVPLVAKCLAELRGITVRELSEATEQNFSALFLDGEGS